jgi:hypothetical protein
MVAWRRLMRCAVLYQCAGRSVIGCCSKRTASTLCQQAGLSGAQQVHDHQSVGSDAHRDGSLEADARHAGPRWTNTDVHNELRDHSKVSMLMALFRQRSHLVAKLDPLGRKYQMDFVEGVPSPLGEHPSRWCAL